MNDGVQHGPQHGLKIFPSKLLQSFGRRTRKGAPLWIFYLLPAHVGAALRHAVIVDSENIGPKSIFTWAWGNESGFTQPPFFLLPTPFLLSHLSSHPLSLALCSWDAFTPFPWKLIWPNPPAGGGSSSFSLCSNVIFSWFASLETVKTTLSETCQGSNISNRFKTFFDVELLTELYGLQSAVCGRAKHGGRAPPRLARVS